MTANIYFWIGFHLLIFLLLALDLGIFYKKAHKIYIKEAIVWFTVWVILALLFNLFVFFEFGKTKALEFFTGYVIEKSLSIDNIFVFILIFTYFSVDEKYQHKILFWGIFGALIMRGIFIVTGVALINRFHWIVIIFGAFLVYSGCKMLFHKEAEVDPDKNRLVRFFRRYFPVSETLHDDKLFIRKNNRLFATPLFVVLLVIESSDLVFAVDSIPAILAISKDTFIVYTSNIFAILGLRSLYFAVSGMMKYFRYLKNGLAFILLFVGLKMLAFYFEIEISIILSLSVIIAILIISILASVMKKAK